jgi:hypothetical protein
VPDTCLPLPFRSWQAGDGALDGDLYREDMTLPAQDGQELCRPKVPAGHGVSAIASRFPPAWIRVPARPVARLIGVTECEDQRPIMAEPGREPR